MEGEEGDKKKRKRVQRGQLITFLFLIPLHTQLLVGTSRC